MIFSRLTADAQATGFSRYVVDFWGHDYDLPYAVIIYFTQRSKSADAVCGRLDFFVRRNKFLYQYFYE